MGSFDGQPVKVLAGQDRFERQRKVFGVMPFALKLTAQDVGEGWLILEQANAYRGGPPRHLHHGQDEWFYVIEGEYVVEIAGQQHRLGPGDSILAPRQVPHTWALVGPGAGRMLIAFQPAGKMEAFFDEATKLPPTQRFESCSPPMAWKWWGHPSRSIRQPGNLSVGFSGTDS